MIAQANAQLVAIAGGGTSEDYDTAAGADTAKWAGRAPAYLVDRVRTSVEGGRLDVVKETFVVVSPGLPIETGDTLTLRQGADTITRVVRDVEEHRVAGTARLQLWPA